ncbi:uncharacterized protein [Typha angustifolia]|uniref:uncharacterized protein n=1 Tax=Typha angustifolia TaxID=59011 RepID=UPI003C2C02D5
MASMIGGLQLPCTNKKAHQLSSPSSSSSSCSLISRGGRSPLRSSLRLKPKSLGSRRSFHFQSIFLEPFLIIKCITALLGAKEEERKKPVTQEKLDDWIKQSISEIVRSVGEAPFLVHIFSGEGKGVRKEREAALPESWPSIKKRWDHENCTPPDGIILVEELKYKDDDDEDGGVGHRSWGVVVQGRGMECAAACYILRTSRVRTSVGFCTHFCLVRAKAFGDPVELQLRNAWLQQEW